MVSTAPPFPHQRHETDSIAFLEDLLLLDREFPADRVVVKGLRPTGGHHVEAGQIPAGRAAVAGTALRCSPGPTTGVIAGCSPVLVEGTRRRGVHHPTVPAPHAPARTPVIEHVFATLPLMSTAVQRSFDDLGTSLSQVTFVVVDVETTGGSPSTASLTEVAAARFRGGELLGTYQTFVRPDRADPAVHHRAHRHQRRHGRRRTAGRRDAPLVPRVPRWRGARRPQSPLRPLLPRPRAACRPVGNRSPTRRSTRWRWRDGSSGTWSPTAGSAPSPPPCASLISHRTGP